MGLLEGKAAAVAVVGLAALIALFGQMSAVMQDLVLAAAAIAAMKFFGGAVRKAFRTGREVHLAVTSDLPERMERQEAQMVVVIGRLDEGQVKFAAIEATLDAFATSERAAVRGALEATQRPRQARASDPGERTGWRE